MLKRERSKNSFLDVILLLWGVILVSTATLMGYLLSFSILLKKTARKIFLFRIFLFGLIVIFLFSCAGYKVNFFPKYPHPDSFIILEWEKNCGETPNNNSAK